MPRQASSQERSSYCSCSTASPPEYKPRFDTIDLFEVNEYWARLLVSEEAADPSNRLPAGPRLPAALKKGEELPLLPLPPGVTSAELSRKLGARRRRRRGSPETPNRGLSRRAPLSTACTNQREVHQRRAVPWA